MVIALVFEHLRDKVLPISEMLFYIYIACLFFLIYANTFFFSCHTRKKWKVWIKERLQKQSQLKVDIEEITRNASLFEHRTFFLFFES